LNIATLKPYIATEYIYISTSSKADQILTNIKQKNAESKEIATFFVNIDF
jgi:hypothetical protein